MSDDRSATVFHSVPSLPGAEPVWHGPLAGIVSLTPFLALARELAALIVPVHLRAEFRDDLGRNLMAAARQQYARDQLMSPTPASESIRASRRWALGAATVGSAMSLAGIAAYVWFHRRRQAA